MKKLIVLLIVLILLGCPMRPEPDKELFFLDNVAQQRGQDYLALQSKHFRGSVAAGFLNTGHSLGNLDWTFGYDMAPVRNIILAVHPLYYRVHLINGPCIRNGRCGRYEIGYGFTKQKFCSALERNSPKLINHIKTRTIAYKQIASQVLSTKFLVSPVLEHDCGPASLRKAFDAVLSIWPDVQLVNSPNAGGRAERYKGAWVERHGVHTTSDTDIVSPDGLDISNSDIEKYKAKNRNAKILFAWTGSYNCRNEQWQDPRKRTSCPNGDMFELMAHIYDDLPSAPAFAGNQCRSIKPFRAERVWKVFSEDKGTNDIRANYPVAILESKAAVMNVLASNGQKVGSLGYYSTYAPLRMHRFYSRYRGGSTDSGYEFQKKAKVVSGNPHTWLQVGSRCWGPIVPGRRNGSYRS